MEKGWKREDGGERARAPSYHASLRGYRNNLARDTIPKWFSGIMSIPLSISMIHETCMEWEVGCARRHRRSGAEYVRRSSISTPLTCPRLYHLRNRRAARFFAPSSGYSRHNHCTQTENFLLTLWEFFVRNTLLRTLPYRDSVLQFSAESETRPGDTKTFGIFGDFDIGEYVRQSLTDLIDIFVLIYLRSLAFAISQEFPSDDQKTQFCWSCETRSIDEPGEGWGAWDRRFAKLLLVYLFSDDDKYRGVIARAFMRTGFRTHVIILTEQEIRRIYLFQFAI